MKTHWETWFTQDTVNTLASYGLTALRIPIGYWSFVDDASSISPYVYGAQDYLDQAIGWAQSAGMKVWVDLHGAPGSQNGYDNSGHEGSVDWQTGEGNINQTISVLTTMAAKYSGSDYANTVVAIELVNEPISWGNNDVEVTRQFYIDAYASARAALTDNQDLMIIMHDSFEDLSYWQDMPSTVGASSSSDGSSQQLLGIDTHRYQVFDDSQTSLDGDGHIENVCSQANEISASNDYMPTYVGEWSAAVNVCFFSNGSSSAGTSCDEDGCSCVTDDQATWTSDVTAFVRKFVEAQMDVWEGKGSGYFFWSQAGPGLWNFIKGVEQGWIPQPLTDREYPSQCGFSLSDMTESSSSKKMMMHRRADEAVHVRRRRAAVAKREPHVLGAHLVEHLARQLS
ncbi:glycoside hydrolase superfamily [Myxozyma melibiosi]|uniref:glucan 1,3-beta-glucosidase n=1 Tax=Myxozyma melibiosi TaxID=54550 RepID=A0ABR1F9T1_9ASCO